MGTWLKRLSGIFLIIFLTCCSSPEKKDPLYEITGITMGTFYSIKVVKRSSGFTEDRYADLKAGVEKNLQKVNSQMSTYLETSEISQFNRLTSSEWFPVSKELAKVVKSAVVISQKSDGFFDVTVGPLVNLWGFGPEHRNNEVPSEEAISAARKKTGFQGIEVQLDPPRIRKTNPQIYCDLSAIAKGFGVDEVSAYLDSKNIPDYLVEIGGEIRAKGKSHLNRSWRVGIHSPDNSLGIQKVVALDEGTGRSIATSGDYRNYFEKDGKRYSHTLNPKTGKPIDHNLASVSVIHRECMLADAFATAINVMGPEAGLRLAEKEDLPVFMIIKTKDGFVEKMTRRFNGLLESGGG